MKKMNTNTVAAMATSEMDTPMYPVICSANVCWCVKAIGRALSKMAKLVRWLHLQTVLVDVDMSSLT